MQQELVRTRIENEQYLRKHPEIGRIMRYLMNKIVIEKPANVLEFSVGKHA
jgi:hypothetical protein